MTKKESEIRDLVVNSAGMFECVEELIEQGFVTSKEEGMKVYIQHHYLRKSKK